MANGLERVDLFVGHRYCSVLATSYTGTSLTYLPVVVRNRQKVAGCENRICCGKRLFCGT